MSSLYKQRLAHLTQAGQTHLLKHGLMGLEKETLRVGADGKLAQTPHPRALGSALTHPYITTDYSEALMEIITPPFSDPRDSLSFLQQAQQFVYRHLENNESLWATSMPCVIAGEDSIPIARYGSSHAGTMKTVYRRGLGHRYGRVMQVIAGVHFNYSVNEALWPVLQQIEKNTASVQDFSTTYYFGMLRNLQRMGWLVPYLFGASPTICKSFLGGKPTTLIPLSGSTYYEPYATSLRMGDIGYQNNKENEVGVKANYNSLREYIDSLEHAINTPYPAYEKYGIKVNGRYEQLNANLLQIENEYYTTVRPKQILDGNEKPVRSLQRRGVRYIELRSLDVNAYDPLGIGEEQLRFLECFMLYCLLQESPSLSRQQQTAFDRNELMVAHHGRQPELQLKQGRGKISLLQWGSSILEEIRPIAELLDIGESESVYQQALHQQLAKIENPDLTPSARMLAEVENAGEEFFTFALRMSNQHKKTLQALEFPPEQEQRFVQWAQDSLQKQAKMEASDQGSFEDYLQAYFSQ